jgi:hypothetical protein
MFWTNHLTKFPVSRLQKYVMLTRLNSTMKYGAEIRNSGEHSKPLVVILGWNDCKSKHLQKYSNIFEAKGWSTICLPTKSFNTFFRSGTEVKTIGLYLAEVIKNETQKTQPVFLYSFSNGGCAVYFHLAEALSYKAGPYFNSINVVGSIFDSCPVKPTLESVPRVQVSITEHMRNPVLRQIVWYAVGLLLPTLVKLNPVLQRFFDDLGKIPLKCPQLFLFSKADHLAFVDDIEEHMNDRRARGVKVFSKCWEDSPHVQHYMKYPEEYVKLLDEFVTNCFNEHEQN